MPFWLQYPFWLAAISGLCFLLERVFPWRRQKAFRSGWGQDLFWLVFNGHYLGVLLAAAAAAVLPPFWGLWTAVGLPLLPGTDILAPLPLGAQIVAALVIKDLLEWCVHNLLHRVPWLWEIHKVHHSIETLDWIGNMRFHSLEVVVYKSLLYLPMVVLGASGEALLWVAVISTLIGHLNHANLAISWGPFRYILNSPKMHVCHHDYIVRGTAGKNFAVVFSLWDWIFGTAYIPKGQPDRLGFAGIEDFPRGLVPRFFYPFGKKSSLG